MFCATPSAERFIACQPWFASLPTDLQERLRHGVYSTEGAKGDVMLRTGSAVEGWHAVLSGLVMLRSPASRGRASAFIGVSDGDWFGEGSAMKPEPRRYDVVALRPTYMLCLPLPLFAALRE
ncbi:MAG: cyclic nucleotide-binding domain-containing protein, partial [Giesbergeria sp.]|nr:cyclic nucleotide-binding domain-containing protein [Giesbergeria sp.]